VLGDFVIDRRPREELEDLLVLPELIGRLPERERRIVLLRYVEELTQDEIAARMRISQMHVSRLLRRAIERMRCQLVDL
jgi:RNA polymerase sigma-B factor